MARRSATVVALLALAGAAPAHAQDPADTLGETLTEQSCRSLVAGTAGIPDETAADPANGIPATWPAAASDAGLPGRVELRTQTETFNRLYEFATRGGRIYVRARGDTTGAWRTLPLPLCFDGKVTGISLDDDELIALDSARRIYTMDNALKEAALFNWTNRWGPPVWTGPGFALPPGLVAWSWSVISKVEDGSWTDPAGNRTAIGDGKVSHIWGLRPGGQRITFWDPWLPLDESYEMCGPYRGRFKSVNLAASGSEVFVIGARGDMFTRLYDFDISGHDPIFFQYSYDDQRGKGDGSPIQLPAEPWRKQPKIRGTITSQISVHKTGRDSLHRILRVEGAKRDGTTGYWERDAAAKRTTPWRFHATGRPLSRRRLTNPRHDTSLKRLGRDEDARYRMKDGVLLDYNVYCSPARIRVTENGTRNEYLLHSVDGLRQAARGRGLDDEPRVQFGALEGPRGKFQEVTVRATRSAVEVEERGWRFER